MPRLNARLLLTALTLGMLGVLFVSSVGFSQTEQEQPLGLTSQVLLHRGKLRSYYLYTPGSYDPAKPTPLLLAFHGYLGNARMMMDTTRFNALAEEQGFLVVYADAADGRWKTKSAASDETDEDVSFVQTLIERISQQRSVDPQRVYATGFSNGGFLSHRLACELPDKIAAVATVGSTIGKPLMDSCDPGRPMPVLMINGTDDPVVTWKGEFHKVRYAFRDAKIATVPEMVSFWREKNGCGKNADVELLVHTAAGHHGAQINRYPDCQLSGDVEQVVIPKGGHTWPNSQRKTVVGGFILGQISRDVDASRLIWEFFRDHPMPEEPSEG